MQSEPGSSEEGRRGPEPTMTDADGQAAFLAAVRTLVHGDRIQAQRAGSDGWTAPEPDIEVALPLVPDREPEPESESEEASDWLPGRWVAEPKRRRSVSEKSAKSYRGGRRRRTVEPSALEGASGTEVLVTGTRPTPKLEPPASAESSAPPIEASRPEPEPAPEPEPELAYAPEPPLREPRRSRRRDARRARAAAKSQAAEDRRAARVRAEAERTEARIARAELASDRRAAKLQARVDREEARRAQAEVTAQQKAETLVASAERTSVQRRTKAEAGAAKAQARADRHAEKAQARADRHAEKAQASIRREEARRAQAEAAALRKAEGVVAAADRKVAKRQAAADRRTAKAQTRADRRAAKVEAGLAPAAGASRRERRRERRREAELAKAVAAARTGGPTDARDEARARRESLEDFLVRVEAPRLPEREPRTPRWIRRTVSISVVATLIAGGAVLPWAAPEVRDWMAGLVPDQGTDVVRVEDPPVAPSTEAFIGPVGVTRQAGTLAGVRLEAAGPPREVRIPRLGVDSEVVPISGQSGTLLPPDDPQVLGWWQEGKPVGAQYGTSVVTGHAVHTGGGALDQLGELVAGDSLRVRTDAGWVRYVVQRTRIYSKGALAEDAESIFRLGGPGRLVLISCDDWNGEIYESNAVVYATPTADLPFETEVPDGGPDVAGE